MSVYDVYDSSALGSWWSYMNMEPHFMCTFYHTNVMGSGKVGPRNMLTTPLVADISPTDLIKPTSLSESCRSIEIMWLVYRGALVYPTPKICNGDKLKMLIIG